MGAGVILEYGDGWLAINKPAEVSTHNASPDSPDRDAIAIAEAILRENLAVHDRVRPESGFRPAPVHRLDVGTSGVLLIACQRAMARELQDAFANKDPLKTYLAVCTGDLKIKDGSWTWPLSDRAEGRRDPQGRPPQKPCTTHFQVLETTPYFSVLEARLESGRTHQIRRHAVLAKHSLVGDRRYGTETYANRIREMYGFDRLALHHQNLEIDFRGARLRITAPRPGDIQNLIDRSRTPLKS